MSTGFQERLQIVASLNTIGPKWDVDTIPDLTGKVAIVTGAYAPVSIGFHIAHQLAKHGAKVYVSARTLDKAEKGIEEMKRLTPELKDANLLHPLAIELGNLKEVKEAAKKILVTESRLDILVNNAAMMALPLDKDENGISVSFAVNHLAPFLFTTLLLPLLKKTAVAHPGVRVVNVASTTHVLPPPGITFNSLDDFNQPLGGTDDFPGNMSRYGLSKLANVLFTKELQRRFDAEGIPAISLSMHPGNIKTAGSDAYMERYAPGGERPPGMLDPLEGALTPLFAATKPEVWKEKEKYSGAYLMPYGVVYEPSENARNPELARALWETSEKVLETVLAN